MNGTKGGVRVVGFCVFCLFACFEIGSQTCHLHLAEVLIHPLHTGMTGTHHMRLIGTEVSFLPCVASVHSRL